MIDGVLFDFGGVLVDSPFDSFARWESAAGLPSGLVRRVNSIDPDTNAWAAFERGEIDAAEFARRFEAEAAAHGGRVDAGGLLDVMAALAMSAGSARGGS